MQSPKPLFNTDGTPPRAFLFSSNSSVGTIAFVDFDDQAIFDETFRHSHALLLTFDYVIGSFPDLKKERQPEEMGYKTFSRKHGTRLVDNHAVQREWVLVKPNKHAYHKIKVSSFQVGPHLEAQVQDIDHFLSKNKWGAMGVPVIVEITRHNAIAKVVVWKICDPVYLSQFQANVTWLPEDHHLERVVDTVRTVTEIADVIGLHEVPRQHVPVIVNIATEKGFFVQWMASPHSLDEQYSHFRGQYGDSTLFCGQMHPVPYNILMTRMSQQFICVVCHYKFKNRNYRGEKPMCKKCISK